MVKGSDPERFEAAYRQIWFAFNRSDDPDLSQHERQLLHHVPSTGGVALGWLAQHLALPKSTTSVLVKDLERRGFVHRRRDPDDERRLAVVLTTKGRRRVAGDTVLVPDRLGAALRALPAATRRGLLDGIEQLAAESSRWREG
jgi:MarR family transcriptional regulator, organic hydroperoxide resistance regulator